MPKKNSQKEKGSLAHRANRLALRRLLASRNVLSPSEALDVPAASTSTDPHTVAMIAYLEEITLHPENHTSIDLRGVSITHSDLGMIQNVLMSHPKVKRIDVSENDLDIACARVLLEVVQCNQRIVFVDLHDTGISPIFAARIHGQCELNRQQLHESKLQKTMQTKLRLEREVHEIFNSFLTQVLQEEGKARREVLDEEAAERDGLHFLSTHVKRHREAEIRVADTQEKHKQERAHLFSREDEYRGIIMHLQHVEILALCELEASLMRRHFIYWHNVTLERFRMEERKAWSNARKDERKRLEDEARARKALQDEEEKQRRIVLYEMNCVFQDFFQNESAERQIALEATQDRLDRQQREEAARRRAEEMAKEKKEKDQREKQKALRDFQLKQVHQREKVELDHGNARRLLLQAHAKWAKHMEAIIAVVHGYVKQRFEAFKQFKRLEEVMEETPEVSMYYDRDDVLLAEEERNPSAPASVKINVPRFFFGRPSRPACIAADLKLKISMPPGWEEKASNCLTALTRAIQTCAINRAPTMNKYCELCTAKDDPKSSAKEGGGKTPRGAGGEESSVQTPVASNNAEEVNRAFMTPTPNTANWPLREYILEDLLSRPNDPPKFSLEELKSRKEAVWGGSIYAKLSELKEKDSDESSFIDKECIAYNGCWGSKGSQEEEKDGGPLSPLRCSPSLQRSVGSFHGFGTSASLRASYSSQKSNRKKAFVTEEEEADKTDPQELETETSALHESYIVPKEKVEVPFPLIEPVLDEIEAVPQQEEKLRTEEEGGEENEEKKSPSREDRKNTSFDSSPSDQKSEGAAESLKVETDEDDDTEKNQRRSEESGRRREDDPSPVSYSPEQREEKDPEEENVVPRLPPSPRPSTVITPDNILEELKEIVYEASPTHLPRPIIRSVRVRVTIEVIQSPFRSAGVTSLEVQRTCYIAVCHPYVLVPRASSHVLFQEGTSSESCRLFPKVRCADPPLITARISRNVSRSFDMSPAEGSLRQPSPASEHSETPIAAHGHRNDETNVTLKEENKCTSHSFSPQCCSDNGDDLPLEFLVEENGVKSNFKGGTLSIHFTSGYSIDDQIVLVSNPSVCWVEGTPESSSVFMNPTGREPIVLADIHEGMLRPSSKAGEEILVENDAICLKIADRRCPAEWIRRFLSRLRFANISADPIVGHRILEVTLCDAQGFSCTTTVLVDVVSEDNPTEVFLAADHVMFRLSSIPSSLATDFPFPLVFTFTQAIARDLDTDFFVGGYIEAELPYDPQREDTDCLFLVCPKKDDSEASSTALLHRWRTNDSMAFFTVGYSSQNDNGGLTKARRAIYYLGEEVGVLEAGAHCCTVYGRDETWRDPTHKLRISFSENGSCSIAILEHLLHLIAFGSTKVFPVVGDRALKLTVQTGNAYGKLDTAGNVAPVTVDPKKWSSPVEFGLQVHVTDPIAGLRNNTRFVRDYRIGMGVSRLIACELRNNDAGYSDGHIAVKVLSGGGCTDAFGVLWPDDVSVVPRQFTDLKKQGIRRIKKKTTDGGGAEIGGETPEDKRQKQVAECYNFTTRDIILNDTCIGEVENSSANGLCIKFYPTATTITRRIVGSILRNILFVCKDTPGRRIVSVEVKDSQWSTSTTLTVVDVQSVHTVAEYFFSPSSTRVALPSTKQLSELNATLQVVPFGTVTLTDPDTDYYDGGTLTCEVSENPSEIEKFRVLLPSEQDICVDRMLQSVESQQKKNALKQDLPWETSRVFCTEKMELYLYAKEKSINWDEINEVREHALLIGTVAQKDIQGSPGNQQLVIDLAIHNPPKITLPVLRYLSSCIGYEVGHQKIVERRSKGIVFKLKDPTNPSDAVARMELLLVPSPFSVESGATESPAPSPVIPKSDRLAGKGVQIAKYLQLNFLEGWMEKVLKLKKFTLEFALVQGASQGDHLAAESPLFTVSKEKIVRSGLTVAQIISMTPTMCSVSFGSHTQGRARHVRDLFEMFSFVPGISSAGEKKIRITLKEVLPSGKGVAASVQSQDLVISVQ